MPDAARERILAEKEPARLERWLEKAILAASIAEVIDDPGSPGATNPALVPSSYIIVM